MTFSLQISRQASRFLAGQTEQVRIRLWRAIDALREEPCPLGCRKIASLTPAAWRIRVGDFRVIYEVIEAQHLIWIQNVVRRNESSYKED